MILPAIRLARPLPFAFKTICAALALAFVSMLVGCGGSSSTPPSQLTAIAVGPPDNSIAMGLSRQFTATGLYSDGSKQNVSSQVTWSSANANIASIGNASDTSGLATMLNPGATTITASLGTLSGSTSLTVTAATLVSIGVTATSPDIASGLADAFKATGVYTDNSTQDLTASVTWTSSATNVASVSNSLGSNGLATTLKPGTATITASFGDVSGSTDLRVAAATLLSIAVTPTSSSIAKGTTQQFIATGTYTDNTTQNLTSSVTWASSNSSVGSIGNTEGSNGLATGQRPDSTTITAVVGNVSGSSTLTVTTATLVSIGVTPTSSAVAKGLKSQFTATGIYSDSSTQTLTNNVLWSSSDPTVLTVSNASGYDGLATALNPGTVTVTAALGTVSGSTSLAVTAATLVSIGVTPADSSIARGTTRQFVAMGTYTDNSTQNLTSSVAWTASDTSVGSISNAAGSNGLATAIGLGSVTITAALGGVSGSTALTVTPVVLISIAVTPNLPGIAIGTHQQFVATGTYTDNSTQLLTTSVTWTSSDTTVASISNASSFNGLATAVGLGAVTVTATVGGISGSTGLLVTPATLVSIALTPASSTVAEADNQQFVATGTYTDNTTQDLTDSVAWLSSDGAIAAISNAAGSHGLATAIGAGTTSVSAVLGGLTSLPAMLTVTAAPLVYVTDSLSNTILQYKIGAGGALISTGTVATGSSPLAITADPAGRYLYVSNQGSATVSEYAIGTAGVLSPIGSVVTASAPESLAVDPTSRFVYGVSAAGNAVLEYTIGTDGALTLSGTVAAGTLPFSLAVDPTGHYVYVPNLADNTLSEYAIDAVGALISLGTVPTGGLPADVAVDPSGHYVYVVNAGDQTISQFTIATDGTLIVGNPVATGNIPLIAVVDPTDHYVYVVNQGDNDISEYTIGTDGALTFMATVVTGSQPTALGIDPSGRYVYVTNGSDGTISQYKIGAGGALVLVGTVPAGAQPSGMTVVVGS